MKLINCPCCGKKLSKLEAIKLESKLLDIKTKEVINEAKVLFNIK